MRKLLTLVLALSLLSVAALTQTYNAYQQTTFTSATSSAGIAEYSGIGFHKITWTSTAMSACTVAIDSSTDGTTWTAGGILAGQTCTSSGSSAVTAGTAQYVRVTVTSFTGTSLLVTYTGYASNPSTASIASGTAGQPAVYTSATAVGASPNIIYADTVSGTDMCDKINKSWLLLPANGGIVKATGFSGTQTCAASPVSNLAGNSSSNGFLELSPNVNIVTSAQWILPNGLIIEGNSGRAYGLAGTGAVIQASNTFPTSTPIISYSTNTATGSPQGIRLRNLAINCLPPNNTFITGSTGIQNYWGQEKSGGNDLRIDDCELGIDIEGTGSRNSGTWTDIDVTMPDVTDTTAQCIRVGSTDVTTGLVKGFKSVSCVGGGNGVEPAVGVAIDSPSFSLEDVHFEQVTTGVEIGALHGANAVFLKNIQCQGSAGKPMTSCVDISSACGSNCETVTLIGINAASANVTNLLKDNASGGATITQASKSYLPFYVRELNSRVWSPAKEVLSAGGTPVMAWCYGTLASSSTLFMQPFSSACGTTGFSFQAPVTGQIHGMRVVAGTGGFNASSGVVTVFANGISSGVTCTLGTGTSCSYAGAGGAISAGQTYNVQITTQATETLANVTVAFVID